MAYEKSVKPYAIDDCFSELISEAKLTDKYPSIQVTKAVNSKVYLTELTNNILNLDYAKTIYSIDSLEKHCGSLLFRGHTFLIKEEYGVSGKGNLHVRSEKELAAISKFLRRQESNGRTVRLVVEEFLPKEFDFSSHFNIASDGIYSMIGLQEMKNNNLAFMEIPPKVNSLFRRNVNT